MSEIKLDPQNRQMLLLALFDAFKNLADINRLTQLSLAKPLDYFDKHGTSTRSAILAVIDYCEAQGGNVLQLLLEVALKENPYHHELHKVAAQLGIKGSGVKLARRPLRPASTIKPDDINLAVRQLKNNYPEIARFSIQVWEEILATLNLQFNMASSSGNLNRQRFPKLVGEMMLQDRLQELENAIKKASIGKLDEEKKQNDVINDFNIAYEQSNWDKVIRIGEKLEVANIHNQSVRNKTAQAYKRRGKRHYDNRHYGSAIECFTRAIHFGLRISQADCYYLRGQAYFAQGEYDKALDDFEQSIERDASKPAYHYEEGKCYRAQKQYSKAIEVFDWLIANDPQNAEYYYQRGVCYFDLHNAYLASFIQRSTNPSPVDMRMANQAASDFRAAINYNPRHADAWYGLGLICYLWKNEHREAEYYFERAAGLGHTDALKYYLDIRRGRGII